MAYSSEQERRGHIGKIEAEIESIMERAGGLPSSFAEIADLPYKDHADLLRAIESKMVAVQKFSFDWNPGTLSLLATPMERFLSSASLFGSYGLPVAGVIMTFAVSPWFLLSLLCFPWLSGKFRKIYTEALFRGAFLSERIFVFLFATRQVGIYQRSNGRVLYYKDGRATE